MDPDETAHYEPSHLDLQCLQNQLLLCLARSGFNAKQTFISSSKMVTWSGTVSHGLFDYLRFALFPLKPSP